MEEKEEEEIERAQRRRLKIVLGSNTNIPEYIWRMESDVRRIKIAYYRWEQADEP